MLVEFAHYRNYQGLWIISGVQIQSYMKFTQRYTRFLNKNFVPLSSTAPQSVCSPAIVSR